MRSLAMGWSALALGVALAVAGCDRTPSEPVAATDGDPALQAAADGALSHADLFRHGPPGGGLLGPLFFPDEDGSPPDCREVDGETRCPPGPPEGLEVSHAVTFRDAAGATMAAYEEGVTASAAFVIDARGEVSRGRGTGQIDRHQELTVTGLLDDPATGVWNGTGTSASTLARTGPDGQTWTHAVETETVVADVVVPRPRSRDGWPLSGTVTERIRVTGQGPNGPVADAVTAVVTFNGTRYATLTVDGQTRELDLARRPGGPGRGGPGGPGGPRHGGPGGRGPGG